MAGTTEVIRRAAADIPPAMKNREELDLKMKGRRPAVFLDYDGTLTPIVNRPEDALLAEGMKKALQELARRHPVAIVSGRDRADVMNLVGLPDLIYAGSHGFDITGPGGMKMEHEEGAACQPDLTAAEKELNERLGSVPGHQVERKRFAIAVHYRNVAEADEPRVVEAAAEVLARYPRLRKGEGKKVFELRPAFDWHKGKAVWWLLRKLELDGPDVVPFYLGDDKTDEDAFAALGERGIGVLIGDHGEPSAAGYSLRDVDEAKEFLGYLAGLGGHE